MYPHLSRHHVSVNDALSQSALAECFSRTTGAQIAAKHRLQALFEESQAANRSLPKLFLDTGEHCSGRHADQSPLLRNVLGLATIHEGECREWETFSKWEAADGPMPTFSMVPSLYHSQLLWHSSRPALGGNLPSDASLWMAKAEDSEATHPAFHNSPLLLVAPDAAHPASHHWRRSAWVVGLSEVFLCFAHVKTAAELHERWRSCEVVIGKKAPRGTGGKPTKHRGRWWR